MGKIVGGSFSEDLIGTSKRDIIYGKGGNDRITGRANNDLIFGGNGSDLIDGGVGHDKIFGGAGNDTITHKKGNDTISGGDGKDEIQLFVTSANIPGGHLDGGNGSDTLVVTQNVSISGQTHFNYATDTLSFGSSILTTSSIENFLFNGSAEDDEIAITLAGNISGYINVKGGDGIDKIFVDFSQMIGNFNEFEASDFGTAVNNTPGNKWSFTTTGIEIVHAIGNDANNKMAGLFLNDTLVGNGGKDSIRGLAGNDQLFGNKGNDTLLGEDGRDRLVGGRGNDNLTGGKGNDTLLGGAGKDSLYGSEGNDLLKGDLGADTLVATNGHDTLEGGQGADVFEFRSLLSSPPLKSALIADFEVGVDLIRVSDTFQTATFGDLSFTQVGTDVLLSIDFGSLSDAEITIANATVAEIDNIANFLF